MSCASCTGGIPGRPALAAGKGAGGMGAGGAGGVEVHAASRAPVSRTGTARRVFTVVSLFLEGIFTPAADLR
ncbi:hypothetical protein GCM10017788_58370 [Amycolatopsis acidiphila]|nr:hypothetical protein GCM10017788_58370 [Amycolatopsis acidiphila]